MNSDIFGISAGIGLSMTGLALSVSEITAILSLCSTGLGLVLLLINGLILPLIKWYKKAKADGKITVDEVEEVVNIVADGTEKIKNEIDKK